jgi:hypothetical protein
LLLLRLDLAGLVVTVVAPAVVHAMVSVVGTVAASGTHCDGVEALAAAVVVVVAVAGVVAGVGVAVDEGKGERGVGAFLAAGVLQPRT